MSDLVRLILTNQIIAFVIVVGVVVFVHELGHFLAARLFGIAVEEFAIGFGPKAFGFVSGGTEYKICWLPLGGYVRLYGSEIGRDIPPEKRHKAISTAAVHKRAVVVFAGPLANALLTWVVLSGLSLSGIEKLPAALSVMPEGVAARAGLRDGDTVVGVNGSPVRTWDELTEFIADSPGEKLHIKVRRGKATRDITVIPELVDDESAVGEKLRMGRIGVTPYFQNSQFAILVDGLLGRAGLRSGDKIVEMNGRSIIYAHEAEQELEDWLVGTKTTPLVVKVLRPKLFPRVVNGKLSSEMGASDALLFSISGTEPWFSETTRRPSGASLSHFAKYGAVPMDLMVVTLPENEVRENERSALEAWSRCGLQSGTSLIAIGDYGSIRSRVQLNDWIEKRERLLSKDLVPGTEMAPANVTLSILTMRGTLQELSCTIPLRLGRDHLNRPHAFIPFPIRFLNRGELAPPVLVKSDGIPAAFRDGAKASWDLGKGILGTVGKLVTGKIPMANLGGPIEIARVAGSAAKVGFSAFITMIAFISINVGLLNLLPIPVLDGGSLLLLAVEGAYGKPLPLKIQETVQKVGVIFILGLILLVIYNDILRRISN